MLYTTVRERLLGDRIACVIWLFNGLAAALLLSGCL